MKSYEVKRIMARILALTSRCTITNRLDLRKHKNFGTDIHKNLFQYGVDELEGYPTKTSNSTSSVEKERSIHLRESQSAAKICPVQGILRSTCSYNATAPNENVRECDLVISLAGASTSCKAWSVHSIKGFGRTRCTTPPI